MSLIDIDKLLEVIVPDQKSTDKKKQVGLYAGGFKPPTSGHFKVVMKALRDNPDLDELKILIGNKDRDGVTQAQSMLIWDIYKKYLPFKVNIMPVTKPPIKAVYDYAKENQDEQVSWIIGAREGNEDDFKDIADRTKASDNYKNLVVRPTITQSGASGTAARNASKVSQEKLEPLLPTNLNQQEKDDVFNILNRRISENKKNCGCGQDPCITYGNINEADPKKGTGKKPKGSGRRLYTDEDPKDTVGVKFSTRQDIVDTLNKKSFKAKSHARQSQIINLIHQRVRAALSRTKDPAKKKKLKSGFEYIKQRKEASKKKTQRLKKKKLNEKLCKRGKAYIAKRKRQGEKHNPFLAGRAVKVCKGQMSGVDGKQKKDFRPKKGKTRSAQGRKPDIVKEIGIDLSNYSGQVLPGDVLRAPKGFPLGGKKLEKSKQLKVIKNSREGVNRYKLSLEDSDGKRYTVRNFQMDGEYKGEKFPKWSMVRRSKQNIKEDKYLLEARYKKFLNEAWEDAKASVVNEFVNYCMEYLSVDRPKLKLINSKDYAYENRSLGGYSPSEKKIMVVVHNRNMADILRTVAHEMVHHMQNLDKRLTSTSGEDGSPDENEANSLAGVIMRKFGRDNPHIYE